ncbi:YgeY family selenium metabolism-linked hydrolase [Pontibacillus yanchengensis]|uniref:YgeY family selenium metabolism-linked hydrolase n=1 Tax=Pontibacillus yanchengensis TaxID=462910 RepID=UPI0013720EA4
MTIQTDVIDLTQQAVRIQSLSGEEGTVASLLYDEMKKLDYDEVWIDAYGSLIGKIAGEGRGQSVLFDGHIDTVPVNSPEKWTYDPFGAEIVDGKMYGRGTSDMKGAVCAAIVAGGEIGKEVKRTGVRPEGDIYISASVCEETFEGAALEEIVSKVHPDNVVIMEPSDLNISKGQLGRAEIKINAHGRSAHSSTPDAAVNAIHEMNSMISGIMNLESPTHPDLGTGISVVTDIISSPYPGASVIPDQCQITVDRRLLEEESEQSVLRQYDALVPLNKQFTMHVTEAELSCYTGKKRILKRFFPGWLMEEDSPIVQASLSSLQAIEQDPEIVTYQFCTNGSYSAGIAGIPTIGYGPSSASLVHIVDEYIETEQLTKAAEGIHALAMDLTGSLSK